MKSCVVRSEGSLGEAPQQRLVSFVFPFFHRLSVRDNFNLFTFQPQRADCLDSFTLSSDKWTPVLISPLSSYGAAFRLVFHVLNQRLTHSHQSQRIRDLIFF